MDSRSSSHTATSAKGKEIMIMDPNVYNSPDDIYADWDTDDELEMEFFEATLQDKGASSPGSSSYNSSKVDHFVSMGFPEKRVVQAIKENGEDNDEAILNSLLTYSAIEDTSSGDDICLDDFSDSDGDNCRAVKGTERYSDNKDKTISILVDMGYQIEDVLIAIERCGYETPIEELADYICAAEMAKVADVTEFRPPPQIPRIQIDKKRKAFPKVNERHRKRPDIRRERSSESYSHKLMIGYGVPGCAPAVCHRKLPDHVVGPPYFYYENVALTPKGVWDDISRFLYDIEPEFVDSIYFSAAARKRGYIHNLPIDGRQPLLPIPPKTIHEAIPDTKKWWPSWDKRTKLNCLLTCIGSAQLTERIRKRVLSGDPSEADKQFVVEQCKKWNLVWVGKNRVAVLEPEDMEMLLGFPRFHTRGLSRTDRYKTLGNSFQIDTVAYHLSVLKPLYPNGMNVLSLFSGIGGAEVALYKLGITLNNVVSVEISPSSRKVLQDWWEENGLQGKLIHVDNVEKVDKGMLDRWIDEFNGFDLVIGGSPCNNLAGGNRRTRDGLEGEHSSLFFQYYRILNHVRDSMKERALS
ncbi:hypothetical protein RDABS01_002047 [Bienertia sinuspersici]